MATTKNAGAGILSETNAAKREEIVELLTQAYWMEMETVMSYLANGTNLDGIRAEEVAEALDEDVNEELAHARAFAQRIKELYGTPPGSAEFTSTQSFLQPPADAADVVTVIKGVIEAERGAIEHYNRIIEATDGVDWATQDMVIAILRDEEGHMRKFERYLREFE
jgi:bacterioferritin